MKNRAYHEYYLEDAMTNLAILLDYAVNYHHHNIDEFWQCFLTANSLAERFAKQKSRSLIMMQNRLTTGFGSYSEAIFVYASNSATLFFLQKLNNLINEFRVPCIRIQYSFMPH